MNRFIVVFTLALASLAAFGARDADTRARSEAILKLLNSRAAGSPRGYAEAAKIVAEDAAKGKPLQRLLIALVSNDRDAPAEARLDPETRKTYLDGSRDKIRTLAEERGNALAWYLLSLEKNDESMLKRAAEGGNVQALNSWGTITLTRALRDLGEDTNDVERVLKKSCSCFQKAADQGDANGLYNLGMCYWRGLGVAQDDQKAFDCLRAAAEKGHPEAINNIGGFFRDGVFVERDLEMSAKWFEKSASYENAYGQFNYALALRRGEGVKKDEKKAVKYLEKAADNGCAEAVNTLGVALWKGEGIAKDEKRAFNLFLRAAMDGYPPAMENVSTCYERGEGVRVDEEKSLIWKMRSRAARGDRGAQEWLRSKGI